MRKRPQSDGRNRCCDIDRFLPLDGDRVAVIRRRVRFHQEGLVFFNFEYHASGCSDCVNLHRLPVPFLFGQ